MGSSIAANQLVWHHDLTGQVLDPASLNLFWFELTEGAYGQIHRVKAIVEIVDGSAWQLSFNQGEDPMETELPVERWLSGRPDRPSQIEVVAGVDFDPIGVTAACRVAGSPMRYYSIIKPSCGSSHENRGYFLYSWQL
ncbi:MAG: hypothetical protein HC860_15275 [Alkalinema sp. RU_4_3]|nr:hypothetical protein [Alkalinema sp. RU_4_3]